MSDALETPRPGLHQEPLLAQLLAYWTEKRRGRDTVRKRDIDATEIDPELLPFIGLSELEPATGRVRYRLVGTGLTQRHGIDPTGKYLDEVLQGAYCDYIIALHRECQARRQPVYADDVSRRPTGQYFRAKRLLLPLADDGDAISFVLIAMRYFAPPMQDDESLRWYESGGELLELERTIL